MESDGADLAIVGGGAAGLAAAIFAAEAAPVGHRIVVLDGARLVEVGTHEELMARNGQYAELYSIQAAAYR